MVDHSALAVVRRSLTIVNGLPERDHREQTVYRFEVPQLKQYQKGTPYPEIIAHIRDVVLPQRWIGYMPRLVVDAGGVGGGIVDMLLDAKLPVSVIALTITGGAAVTKHCWPRSRTMHWHAAKSEIVSVVHGAFQSGRVTIYPMPPDKITGRDHAATLKKEMRGFTVQQTKAANEIYTHREGEHDDILLATALPIFLGQRREYVYQVDTETAPRPLNRDEAALEDSEIATAVAEKAALAAEAEVERKREDAEYSSWTNPAWWT